MRTPALDSIARDVLRRSRTRDSQWKARAVQMANRGQTLSELREELSNEGATAAERDEAVAAFKKATQSDPRGR